MNTLKTRQAVRRAQLLSDGRKALALVAHGHDIKDVLAVIGGSRARLYRAMGRAAPEAPASVLDPLLW